MLSLFFACLLLWAVILVVIYLVFGVLFLNLVNNFFGLLFLVAFIPAVLTALYLNQKDKISALETRISKLEDIKKEQSK